MSDSPPDWTSPDIWRVERGRGLTFGHEGTSMRSGCIHRKDASGACSGCAARFHWALDVIRRGAADGKAVAEAVAEAERREYEALKAAPTEGS